MRHRRVAAGAPPGRHRDQCGENNRRRTSTSSTAPEHAAPRLPVGHITNSNKGTRKEPMYGCQLPNRPTAVPG
ncbi:hypothetical protein C791_6775 [Amycolatopsis azurea DSM 43854]|uniref:Uncharacterized protein n=1 Tax=Amycolatopsis azurea DSM 43854 TaxID=1238180 RepID=M2NNC9_9PSEU|nr:hypothetical protein C791_6775 [Amycolatopsis azurea DSM 43854]